MNNNLTKYPKYLILAFLLFMASNGGFSISNKLSDNNTNFSSSFLDNIPLFVENSDLLLKTQTINPDILKSIKYSKTEYLRKQHERLILSGIEEKIMTRGKCSVDDLASFLMYYNTSISYYQARLYASYYISESELEGVNSDIAFVQMCLETGFLKFSGTVQPDQNNFCGLGTVNKFTPGLYFPSKRHGVRAHIQHLKAYASFDLPQNKIIDKRFDLVQRGTALNIDELTGKWASDPNYSGKIRNLLFRLNTIPKETHLFLTNSGL